MVTGRRRIPTGEQHQRIVDLWRERPRTQRTVDDLLVFYGWLSEHQPDLLPTDGEGGVYRRLSTILADHLVEEPRR